MGHTSLMIEVSSAVPMEEMSAALILKAHEYIHGTHDNKYIS